MKFIVSNRTDAWKTEVNLFFTMTNCKIVCSHLLTHCINYKFMHLSAYWRCKLANECARISAVIVKIIIECILTILQAYSIPSSPPPNSSQRSLSASDSQDESEEKLSKTNLYIRGLSPGTTDEDLNNLCSRLVTWTGLDNLFRYMGVGK